MTYCLRFHHRTRHGLYRRDGRNPLLCHDPSVDRKKGRYSYICNPLPPPWLSSFLSTTASNVVSLRGWIATAVPHLSTTILSFIHHKEPSSCHHHHQVSSISHAVVIATTAKTSHDGIIIID